MRSEWKMPNIWNQSRKIGVWTETEKMLLHIRIRHTFCPHHQHPHKWILTTWRSFARSGCLCAMRKPWKWIWDSDLQQCTVSCCSVSHAIDKVTEEQKHTKFCINEIDFYYFYSGLIPRCSSRVDERKNMRVRRCVVMVEAHRRLLCIVNIVAAYEQRTWGLISFNLPFQFVYAISEIQLAEAKPIDRPKRNYLSVHVTRILRVGTFSYFEYWRMGIGRDVAT